jgi:hypothetical protein
MLRLRAIVAALLLGSPLAASAADITRIASSFDDDDPFDFVIDVSFDRTQTRTKIVREQLAPDGGGLREATEVWHKGVDSRLNIELAIGLYRDLEFSFGMPLILQQNDSFGYVSGTTDINSTIVNNCVEPSGAAIPGCGSSGAFTQGLFTVDPNSPARRGGLGNMRFGLAYAFFNQDRDDTKPMWIVGIDYEAPTAKLRDPSFDETLGDNKGNVGDRVHKYTFYTSFSRRMGVAEPYFKASYTLPVAGPGIYSNCFDREETATPGEFTSPTLGRPNNCFARDSANNVVWSRKETGIQAPHIGGVIFGSEFTAFNDREKGQKLGIDLRTIGNYVSVGRYYNELSSAMRKLLATQDYFQLGGQVGVTALAGDAFMLRASGTFLYNTDHTLTDELIGKDLDDDGNVNVQPGSIEVNPNFDFRTDLTSRRFLATESKIFQLELMASFSF